MTARRSAAGLATLLGAALLMAACGPAANATTAPTPTTAAATEAAGSEAPASDGLPGFSFVLPSFTADTQLEALFPDSIGGKTMAVSSMNGTDFLSMGTASKDVQTALQQLGKSPSDLSVAYGSTFEVTIFAFRIKGVPADQFLGKYLGSTAQGATVTDASYGGKSVKKVVNGGQGGTYIYLSGDILWTVGGTGTLTDALLNEAFSKLP
jgi:hypothetical protein